jgi:hypothetical protein
MGKSNFCRKDFLLAQSARNEAARKKAQGSTLVKATRSSATPLRAAAVRRAISGEQKTPAPEQPPEQEPPAQPQRGTVGSAKRSRPVSSREPEPKKPSPTLAAKLPRIKRKRQSAAAPPSDLIDWANQHASAACGDAEVASDEHADAAYFEHPCGARERASNPPPHTLHASNRPRKHARKQASKHTRHTELSHAA